MKHWKAILGMTATFFAGVMASVGYLNDGLALKETVEQSRKVATLEISTVYFGVDKWPVNIKKLTPELEGSVVTDNSGNVITEMTLPSLLIRLKAENQKSQNVSFGNIRICKVIENVGCPWFQLHLIDSEKYNPQGEMNTPVNVSANAQDFLNFVLIGESISSYKGQSVKVLWQDQEGTHFESKEVVIPEQPNGQITFQL
ncbi:TPA: hypothetical protein ACF31M_004575 [Vibrio parahaemolyticus]|uniref:hypothetical protein n=1 Tax=Vibrio parahaemolyticus TaxID=670 RepID=UPI0015DEF363|nr:hypothetical protein [Vibrio parahaemolyticus]